MAVAVKTPETRSKPAPTSIQVLSLVGLVFLLGSLAAVLWGIPTYLPQSLPALGLTLAPYTQSALIALVMIAAAIGLGFVGNQVLGEKVEGVRAGMFVSLGALLFFLMLASWFGGPSPTDGARHHPSSSALRGKPSSQRCESPGSSSPSTPIAGLTSMPVDQLGDTLADLAGSLTAASAPHQLSQ